MSEFPYTTQLQALGRISQNISQFDFGKKVIQFHPCAKEPKIQANFQKLPVEDCVTLSQRCLHLVSATGFNRSQKSKSVINITPKAIEQFIYLYTARAQEIFHDFVTEVYWTAYEGGRSSIEATEIRNFIENALIDGKMRKNWEESTIKRVSGYLGGVVWTSV